MKKQNIRILIFLALFSVLASPLMPSQNLLFAQDNFELLNTIEGDSEIFGTSTGLGDFDEDGRDDLAYLLDKFTINNTVVRTQVYLTYSTKKKPASEFETAYTSDEGNELSDSSDDFGSVIKTGDLNGDGHSDLIITSPETRITDGKDNIGCIRIYYGDGDMPVYKGKTVLCGAEAEEYFGQNIAVGDLDYDGRDDLAVYSATQVEEDQIFRTKGKVSIFYGRKTGIKDTADVVLTAPEQAYAFGRSLLITSLHVGDVPVLVVGAPRDETVSMNGGKVFVYPGMRGFRTLEEIPEYTITGEAYQCIGTSLASGELFGNQGPDLVVGASEDYGCGGDSQVLVFAGLGDSVSTTPVFTFDGSRPVVGQFHSEGYDDLAFIKEGKVNVHFGKTNDLLTDPDAVLSQENVTAITLGDLTGDKKADLVVSYMNNFNDGNVGIFGYDECPNDSDKLEAGSCGCGNPDTDSNDNGVADCLPTAEAKYYVTKAYRKLKKIGTSSSSSQVKLIKKYLRKLKKLVEEEDIQVKAGVAVNVEDKILAAVKVTKKALKLSSSRFVKNKKIGLRKLKNVKGSLGEDVI